MDRTRDEIIRVFHAVGIATWRRLAISFLAFALPVFLFVQLADEVRDQETASFDKNVLLSVNSISNDALDAFVVATTDLGYVWWVAFATIVAASLCVRAHRYKGALIIVVGVVGSAVMNLLLKLFFQRDRPELWERLVTENSFSFPSGHAMASASLAMVLIVVLWPTKWRYPAMVLGGIYMIYIGFTRMYLGVHYPTDILAGWLVAAAWVAISVAVINKLFVKKS